MARFTKIKLTKSKPVRRHNFITQSLTEYDKLIKLRDEGYHITVIKNIEHSVNEYIRLNKNGLTIHSIEHDEKDVRVTVFRNEDYFDITISKALFKSSKPSYEFSIGCANLEEEIVDIDCKKRVKSHKTKSDIIFIGD